ncbi:hypothetical protein KR018_011990 [Drosophila ironensis]|nr:hypothetical protein KR018_011990 [Drosophila ironensis]
MASYEEVKDVPKHPEVYLIDVRNRDELKQTGSIPASLNIPLGELEQALKMNDDAFKKQYGRQKPGKNSKIIFSCRSGNRTIEAEKKAKELGFTNAVMYKGSWQDWAKREGLPN